MKTKYRNSLRILGIISCAFSSVAADILYDSEDTILASFSFDGSIENNSEYPIESYWKADPGSFVSGRIGQAIRMNGEQDASYVCTKRNPILDAMDALTVTLSARRLTPESAGTLIHKHLMYWMALTPNGVKAYVFTEDSGRINLCATVPSTLNTEWHDYALTYNGTEVRLLVDGETVDSAAASGLITHENTKWHGIAIGKNPWKEAFEGDIDNVIVSANADPLTLLAPKFADIYYSDLKPTEILLNWKSDKPTKGYAVYTDTTGTQCYSPWELTFGMEHEICIRDLQPEKTYDIQIVMETQNGLTASSEWFQFDTPAIELIGEERTISYSLVPYWETIPASGFHSGEEVLFNAYATEDTTDLQYADFEWDFGDGFTTNGQGGIAISHIFAFPGTYTVKLTVTNTSEYQSTYSRVIEIGGASEKLAPRVAETPCFEMNFDEGINDSGLLPGIISVERRVVEEDGSVTFGEGTIEFADGVSGKALNLRDGNYLRIETEASKFSEMNGLTFSFWIKLDGPVTEDALVLAKYPSFRTMLCASDENGIRAIMPGGVHNGRYHIQDLFTSQGWHHFAITNDKISSIIYIDGVPVSTAPAIGGWSSFDSTEDLYIGYDTNAPYGNWAPFEGYLDDLKIYDRALTREELFGGFEMWHADFNHRTAQYVDIKVPGALRVDPNNRLKVELQSNDGYQETILDKSPIDATERILLDHSQLQSGIYYLRASVVNEQTGYAESISERFEKAYDGIPEVGFDENNSIRVNGELFFPITANGLGKDLIFGGWDYAEWDTHEYVNTLSGEGFGENYNHYGPESWVEYTKLNPKLYSIGPELWHGLDPRDRYTWRNSDIGLMIEYIQRMNAEPDRGRFLMWGWADEPDLTDVYVPPPVVRSWNLITRHYDPTRPMLTNLTGYQRANHATDFARSKMRRFSYCFNGVDFGQIAHPLKGVHVSDMLGLDYYPVDWATPHGEGATMQSFVDVMTNAYDETGRYVPMLGYVETTEIGGGGTSGSGGSAHPTPWHPSGEQIQMLCWANVVYGMKALTWFHYFERNRGESFEAMKRFKDQIEILTPVVLGPDTDLSVSASPQGSARVETMIKEYEGKVYLIAVRLTDIDTEGQPIGVTEDVRFELDPSVSNRQILVFDEYRKLQMNGNSFWDSFEPYAVHIYEIAPAGEQVVVPVEPPDVVWDRPELNDTNVIGYWDFENIQGDQVPDRSSNQQPGVMIGDPVVDSGRFSDGLSFDGLDDCVIISNTEFEVGDEFTVSLWIKPTHTPEHDQILFTRGRYSNPFNVALSSEGTRDRIYGNVRADRSAYPYANKPILWDEWNHVAFRYEAQAATVFVNGLKVYIYQDMEGTPDWSSIQDMAMGRSVQGTDGKLFNGVMDEVLIVNEALTDREIKYLAKSNNPVPYQH